MGFELWLEYGSTLLPPNNLPALDSELFLKFSFDLHKGRIRQEELFPAEINSVSDLV